MAFCVEWELMASPLFYRKRKEASSGDVSNWILSTLCIFMCYFGMIDMTDNCLTYGVLICRAGSPIEVSRSVESFCILNHCASVENNITVYVCITMPVVIKLWFLCHFSDDAGDQYVWYILI